jgi:hypothetical protein
VRSTPSLQTLAGFLSFMGSQQAEQVARALVLFSSSPASSALELPTYNCCNFPTNITEPGALGNSSCPCASCLGTCPGGNCSSSALAA